MSRRTSGRGYLQQLAQPVAPGETVLTARPGATAFGAEPGPVAPVVEDHFETQARTVSARGFASARADRHGMNQDSAPQMFEAVERSVGEDAIALQPARTAARIDATDRKTRATQAGRRQQQPPMVSANADIHGNDLPVAAPRKNSVRERREERFDAQPAVTSKMVADRREPTQVQTSESPRAEANTARVRVESRLRTEQDSGAKQSIAEKSTGKEGQLSHSARPDYCPERTAIERATEAASASKAAQQQGKPEVQTDAGPRVHIGTVEIRMKLPQPPAPPPAAPAPNVTQNNAAAHARGRGGLAEPLARGLEWSYGLVQG